ncbi:MAG: hypothetical protein QMC90_03760, partial [Dehalococcoidales bacterium]|nr:hypothetical protein [Dehalococcoidales bacterium]
MGSSFQGQSNCNEIRFSRIQAAVGNLANAKGQIEKEGIKGDVDESLRRFLCGIFDRVQVEINDIVQEIS